MKILVMGTGGMGGYYGALLARQGEEVSLVTRGVHLETILKNGLTIKSIHGDFIANRVKATDNPAEIGPMELVLFCLKNLRYQRCSAGHHAYGLAGTGGYSGVEPPKWDRCG